jgi:hypothetical protein
MPKPERNTWWSGWSGRIVRKPGLFAVVLAATCCSAVGQSDPNQLPTAPALGRYTDTLSNICGRNRVDVNPTKIPFIGCFALKAGMSLSGDIDGRAVTIRVSPHGEEIVEVDGVAIRQTNSSTTNIEGVKPSSSGFAFCTKEKPQDCPVLSTLMRQPEKFVTFDVSRAFKPRSYVTNQENWNFESKR